MAHDNPNVMQCLTCQRYQTVSVVIIKQILAGKVWQWCENCAHQRVFKNAKVYKLNLD